MAKRLTKGQGNREALGRLVDELAHPARLMKEGLMGLAPEKLFEEWVALALSGIEGPFRDMVDEVMRSPFDLSVSPPFYTKELTGMVVAQMRPHVCEGDVRITVILQVNGPVASGSGDIVVGVKEN